MYRGRVVQGASCRGRVVRGPVVRGRIDVVSTKVIIKQMPHIGHQTRILLEIQKKLDKIEYLKHIHPLNFISKKLHYDNIFLCINRRVKVNISKLLVIEEKDKCSKNSFKVYLRVTEYLMFSFTSFQIHLHQEICNIWYRFAITCCYFYKCR